MPAEGRVSYITCHICLELGLESRAEDGSLICRRHSDRIWTLLDRIRIMSGLIDSHFLAASHDTRSEMGTKSLPPCSLDPIVVTDPRSRYLGKGDLVSAPRVLGAWQMAIGDSTGLVRPYLGIRDSVLYLQAHLSWIQRQPAITRFARHIGAVHRSLRLVTAYD